MNSGFIQEQGFSSSTQLVYRFHPCIHLRQKQDDLLAAREDLERCARMEPDNLDYMLDEGHACADLGEWERAEFYWRQALRLDERSEEAFIELADTRRNLHDPEGARRLLRECLLLHPESGSAQIMLAELEAN